MNNGAAYPSVEGVSVGDDAATQGYAADDGWELPVRRRWTAAVTFKQGLQSLKYSMELRTTSGQEGHWAPGREYDKSLDENVAGILGVRRSGPSGPSFGGEACDTPLLGSLYRPVLRRVGYPHCITLFGGELSLGFAALRVVRVVQLPYKGVLSVRCGSSIAVVVLNNVALDREHGGRRNGEAGERR